MSDPEVSYYLGIAYDGLGRNRDARESYEAAARLPAFRAAAELRLAELSAREGNLIEAESHLRLATDSTPDDLRCAEELIAVLRAEGQKEKSQKLTQEWLTRFPHSYFLLEQAGRPDLHHLANDSDRVLNVASEYMRLGMYSQALDVLSRNYPEPVADESEPEQLAPNKHPLVAYYRGYCREKLGQSGAADFSAAAKLSTDYVFPSRGEDVEVLTTASRANPNDASAHYLVGTLYFSKGLTDQALVAWDQARKLNSQIPVLHASLGRALLHVKNDPQAALQVFQEGLRTDAHNIALYTGIDQALSILRRPPQERVAALEQYPDQANMPTPLLYELILNVAESGDFEKAAGLFHNRFFQREEGGTNVRQVWLEVKIQQALSQAQGGRCSAAIQIVGDLAEPMPDLEFTHDGLQPFLRSARFNYLLGSVYRTCNLPDRARDHFTQAAEKSNFEDAVWAWKASQELPNFDLGSAKHRLESILEQASNAGESSSPSGWWLYNVAMLGSAAGNNRRAEKEFREALLSADALMSYHLTRLAVRD
jgi:tetratricopeptide (TPR) repeat protein